MGGKTSYESIKKYQDKAYDNVTLRLKKGEREKIKAHAESVGLSVNAFIKAAIAEKIERDDQQ